MRVIPAPEPESSFISQNLDSRFRGNDNSITDGFYSFLDFLGT